MTNLPYVTAPGNIEKALKGIQAAATPERVSQDFVKTILGIKGGSGNQITSFLKKVGFANLEGSPSELYKSFRNSSKSGRAALEALKLGYRPLFIRNEYAHKLSDDKLKGLITEETGQEDESNVGALILSSFKAMKKFVSEGAETDGMSEDREVSVPQQLAPVQAEEPAGRQRSPEGRLGMNLSYTINLNLPATTDIAVFNAIFKSLRDNMLDGD